MAIWNSFLGNMMGGDKGEKSEDDTNKTYGGSWWQSWKDNQGQQDQQGQQPTVGRDLVHNFINSSVTPALNQQPYAASLTGGYQPQQQQRSLMDLYGRYNQQPRQSSFYSLMNWR